MNLEALSTSLRIAGGAGLLLVLSLFFPWYGTGVEGSDVDATATAWRAFSFIDILLLLAGAGAVGLTVLSARGEDGPLPLPAATLITALGALALILVLYRFLDTPFDLDRRYGLFIGLAAAAGILIGGRMAMREGGETFEGARDEVGRQVGDARADVGARISGPPDPNRFEDMTQEELYEEAQRRDIEGRSDMSKDELIEALRRSRR